jgi:hypothetical protein
MKEWCLDDLVLRNHWVNSAVFVSAAVRAGVSLLLRYRALIVQDRH